MPFSFTLRLADLKLAQAPPEPACDLQKARLVLL
jgi:hypothetical protein